MSRFKPSVPAWQAVESAIAKRKKPHTQTGDVSITNIHIGKILC